MNILGEFRVWGVTCLLTTSGRILYDTPEPSEETRAEAERRAERLRAWLENARLSGRDPNAPAYREMVERILRGAA